MEKPIELSEKTKAQIFNFVMFRIFLGTLNTFGIVAILIGILIIFTKDYGASLFLIITGLIITLPIWFIKKKFREYQKTKELK